MKRFYILTLLCAIMALVACNDDTGVRSNNYSDGLYFDISSREWSANGNKTTRVVSIQEMASSEHLDNPLYLHCEVTEGILPLETQDQTEQGETRAVRYVGPVFNESYGVTSFGIYGTVGAKTAFYGTEVFTKDLFTGTDGGSGGESHRTWREKNDQTINEYWGDTETGKFYGFAPHPDEGGGSVNSCVSVSFSGTPTLTYDMPADAADQRDVLTAQSETVTKAIKNEFGIELEFIHVLAALRFKIAYDSSNPQNSLKWNLDGTTYYIQPTKITINDIYSKGSCPMVTEIHSIPGHWTKLKEDPADADYKKNSTTCTISQTRSQILANGGLITPDANCFMVLPQEISDGVKATIYCDIYTNEACTGTPAKTDVKISAPLYGTNGSDPWGHARFSWCPGYTYTYTISDIDIAYVFDYNTATAKNYNGGGAGVGYTGTSEEDIFIRSYRFDSHGNKTNVDWEPQYYEIDADVTGVGQGGSGDQGSWKTGSNGWIHIYDHSTGSYDTEVLTTHGGANESNTNDEKLFKIEIGTIMTPVMDLSLWNQYQTKRWKGRSTSNCYIVAGPGTYRIPLIYGNAWTKGAVNTVAYQSGLSEAGEANNILGSFRNAYDEDIYSPFIKKDVGHYGHSIKDAVLIWEEGACATNGTVTEGMRHSMGGETGGNNGTVVKVISTIDTAITGEDTYNTENGSAGTLPGCDYLQFTIDYENFNYGNAVVGIRDESNNIVWSWHIWMVNADDFIKDNVSLTIEENAITYANTNIGWVDGGQTIPAQKRTGKMRLVQKESGRIITIDAEQQKRRQFTTYFTNVLYQWGRKDPIRGNVNPADMQNDWGAPRGEAGVTSYEKADFSISAGLGIYGQKSSVGGMIMTPNKAWGLSDGDLYTKVYYNLWASKLKKVYNTNGGTWIFYGKTIYDPSPVGYCVPPSKCLTKLSRGGFAEIGSSVSLPIVCYYNSTLPFHASGVRTTTAGYDLTARGYKQPEALNAANGFYHTATPYSNDECWQLHLYFYSGTDTHNFIRGDMSECLSVKPVLWNGEAVETVEPDQDQEYLTFTFLEAGKFYWVDAHVTQTSRTIQWTRTPNDESSWQNVTSSYDGAGESLLDTHEGSKIADVAMGDKIYVRGTNATYCIKNLGTYYYNYFKTSGAYELSGNIMSLTWGSDFKGKTAFQSGSTFTFCSLFYNPQFGTNSNRTLESVDGLVMPATSLVTSCYESMFEGCTYLVSAPYLPATVGAIDCYKTMYKDCSSLTTVKSALESPSSSYTDDWLDGVASSGTFFYSKTASAWPTGVDGIPSGWSSYAIY